MCETGILAMDPNVLHPFVRIHIIDLKTKKYLKKKEFKADKDHYDRTCYNGTSQFENVGAYRLEKDEHSE